MAGGWLNARLRTHAAAMMTRGMLVFFIFVTHTAAATASITGYRGARKEMAPVMVEAIAAITRNDQVPCFLMYCRRDAMLFRGKSCGRGRRSYPVAQAFQLREQGGYPRFPGSVLAGRPVVFIHQVLIGGNVR